MDLMAIPVVDQHAHNLLTPEFIPQRPGFPQARPYAAAFTEAHDPEILSHHAPHSLSYQRSLRDIGELLGCEPTEPAILEQREILGLEALTQRCFQAANLERLILDDGLLPTEIHSLGWHRQFLPVDRLLRLEHLAEILLRQSSSFEDFLEHFRSVLDPVPPGVVGFKSIAAYRSGLEIQRVTPEAASESFNRLRTKGLNSSRLTDKTLIDFLLLQALEIAAKYHLPVQFHTGFGDRDLDLRWVNPLHLRSVLEQPEFQQVPIVLLHASYPYCREAGYLAAVYPQVYLDFGLAVPFLSVAGMRQAVGQLLELAPTTKIMYSSDAHFIPELYYLGARWGRRILGEVFEESIQAGEITAAIAETMAAAILRENALKLYGLS